LSTDISYLAFVFFLAFVFAKVEIQIEGGAGWAKNLPTWRIESHWLLDLFWGGRPMTGYHAWIMVFVAAMFHLPLFFMEAWSWNLELKLIGGLILFWVIEDFIWFVINPHFGLRKFKKEHVPWHPRWILGLPVDYWIFFPLGFGFVWMGG
jgi:hypothetical protein